MKKIKILASVAALAAVTCMAAVSASAATSIELKLDAAKSTATKKVVDVNFVSDEYTWVKVTAFDIVFDDSINPATDVTFTSQFTATTFEEFDGQVWTLVASNSNSNEIWLTDGSLTLATLTINAEDLDMYADGEYLDIMANNSTITGDMCPTGSLAVINADEVGLFTEGTGAPAKAYKATATVAGDLTWYVTDGTNVASKAATISGAPGVVFGLVATGANAANINYAAIAID
jgi:hypothetical protein